MTRLGRAALVALLVLLMAATPLSAILSVGKFEVWTSGPQRVRVTVQDQTGLLRAVATSPSALPAEGSPSDARLLRLPLLGGCCGTFHIHMTLRRAPMGYEIQQVNDEIGCSLLCLRGYGDLVLILWAPIDPESLTFDSPYLGDHSGDAS